MFCLSNLMIFRAKIGIFEKYLYVNHTLFILYLKRNHTLFGEKLYFIWKFSSGNTEIQEPESHLHDPNRRKDIYTSCDRWTDRGVWYHVIHTF